MNLKVCSQPKPRDIGEYLVKVQEETGNVKIHQTLNTHAAPCLFEN